MRRPVVAFQFDNARGGEVAGKTQQDGNVGPTPGVDGLVFVADDANILPRSREQPHEFVLHAVGVLIFVHVDVMKACLPLFPRDL